ncbi:MAG: hypothetical protein E7632_13490 [Ruminococcaceae bacterium]|nr:hypothetical protein [Oscillospiraceae bacterium]
MKKLAVCLAAILLVGCGAWKGDYNRNSQNQTAAYFDGAVYHIDETTLYRDGEAVISLPEGSWFESITASEDAVYTLVDFGKVMRTDESGSAILYEAEDASFESMAMDIEIWQDKLYLSCIYGMTCIDTDGTELWTNDDMGIFDCVGDDWVYYIDEDSILRFDTLDADTEFADGEVIYTLGDADPAAKLRGIKAVAADDAGNLYYAVSHYENLATRIEPTHKGEVFFDRTLTVAMLDAKTGARTELFTTEGHTMLGGFQYTDALYIGTNGKVWRWDGKLSEAAVCPQAEYMHPDSFYANSEFILTPDGIVTEHHSRFASKDMNTIP